MPDYETRKALFSELISERKRELICLVTSTKRPEQHFSAQIATDLLPLLYKILRRKENQNPIDLLLYSAGGQIDAPWPIVNLIREYCKDLRVIVPSSAHSAATLIALGANEIDMGPLGSLSPIDPQLTMPSPDGKTKLLTGIEDIYGYYLLIQDTLSLDANGRSEALKLLAARIGPEVLGQLSRIRNEIRIIATNMLKLHMKDEKKIQPIVTNLVEKLHSHQYMINRKEALDLGLPVNILDKKSEDISHSILDSYIAEARMDEPGIDFTFGPGEDVKTLELNRAFLETQDKSFTFTTQYSFHKDGKLETRINKWVEAQL